MQQEPIEVEKKQIKNLIEQYKKTDYYDFAGAKLPLDMEIIPDGFFNVLFPHALNLQYSRMQINNFYFNVRRRFPNLIFMRDLMLGIPCPHREYGFSTHGCTYFFEKVDVQPEDIVFDLGASPGDFASVSIAKGAKLVYAFEPCPDGQSVLEAVSCLNENKISLQPYFVSDRTIDKYITLDDFVTRNQIQQVDFIKMDIEGAELQAIQGCSHVLRYFAPKLSLAVYHNDGNAIDPIIKLILAANPRYIIRDYGSVIYGYVE